MLMTVKLSLSLSGSILLALSLYVSFPSAVARLMHVIACMIWCKDEDNDVVALYLTLIQASFFRSGLRECNERKRGAI